MRGIEEYSPIAEYMKSWLMKFFLGNNLSTEISSCTHLGCILKNWQKFGGDPLTREKLHKYCYQWWPNYKWDDRVRWLEDGSLQFNTILQLMLCCRQLGKC